jgi:orotate phosphoribosyltransferase
VNQAAKLLLDCEAVNIRPEQPFTLTSGKQSPVYVDCRRLISYPAARRALMEMLRQHVEAACGGAAFDAVAGGETAGIPYAAWLAELWNLPMLYVRKKPKGFGRNAQIEGVFPSGARVLLVEDMATDGGSKVVFVNALREAGAVVAHTAVLFYYGLYPYEQTALHGLGVDLHALCTWQDILDVARQTGQVSAANIAKVEAFLAT